MDPAAIDDPVATPITPSRPRIGVVAINAGNANLGDEAVLTGALLAIRTRMGDPDITVFSVNPAATAEHHRVRAASLPIGSVGGAGTGPVRRAAHRMWDPLRGMRILAPAGRWSVRLGRAAAGLVALPVAITRLALQLRGTDVMILADEPAGGRTGRRVGLPVHGASVHRSGTPQRRSCGLHVGWRRTVGLTPQSTVVCRRPSTHDVCELP